MTVHQSASKNELDRFRGCLLGLATGDAVGTTLEFQPRGSFPPLTDMLGGGPFQLEPGEWTDDTSMALCLATSLVECAGFDAHDQMERYLNWYENGYLSSNGVCFDIGNTIRTALHRYKESGDPFSGSSDPNSAGNGSLMRLAPVVLFYYPDQARIQQYFSESSRTTHAAPECLDACLLFGDMLLRALGGAGKQDILLGSPPDLVRSAALQSIAQGSYLNKAASNIHGTGYVVKSLEAALWSFWASENFEQAILTAANLGDDADTTAAICGQIAGAHYGASGIPSPWLERLVMRGEIARLAEQLSAAYFERNGQTAT
ncbi:MAG: ADP-ribosylglycohydrolase family protein [Anaerolineales bacterium]|nr:ADP-ribosylglycohydrolase family protein [Anaerolineales bacterium]